MGATSKHFSSVELTCHCGCGRNEMKADFLALLEQIREELGQPMILSSAYRCPEYNAKVSKTGLTGPHTTGRAVDILCFNLKYGRLFSYGFGVGMMGIGSNQKGPWQSRFIHLDDAHDEFKSWSY